MKSHIILGILMLFLTGIPGLLSAEAPGTVLPQKISLQLKWRHQFQFAGYYAAVAKGFYREVGLDVEILEANANKDPADAVIEGRAEFGIAGADLLLLRAKGYPVVVLAPIFQHSPMVFIATENSGISNVHQLAGRKMNLELHSAELLAYLRAEGIEIGDIKVTPHPFAISDLIAGDADVISGYLSDEPFVLKESGIAYRMFMPQASGIDFYGDVLFTTEEQVVNYPERVKAFVEATQKGWRYALKNPEEIVDLILSNYSTRHSREHLLFEAEKSTPLILPEVVEVGYMNIGRWKHIASKYKELGMLDTEIDFDFFIFQPNLRSDSLVRQAIKFGEIFFALLALGFLIKMIRSFTNLEKLDRQNRKINRKLARSRRRYSLLLSNLPGMAYKGLLDESWTMLFVSKRVIELTGYKSASLINNKEISYWQLIHEDDKPRVKAEINKAFAAREPFKLTYRIVTALGVEKWVWEQGRFTGEKMNSFPVIEGFAVDISEEKANARERQELIDDLQKALAENKALRKIFPICSSCKKIRDEKGVWNNLEAYMCQHAGTEFSHGLCSVCTKKLFPDICPESQNDAKKSDSDS